MNKQGNGFHAFSPTDPLKFDALHEYSPADLFMISALGGAGGFGGMRLLTDAMAKFNPPQPKENVVRLAMPNAGQVPAEQLDDQQAPVSGMAVDPMAKQAAPGDMQNVLGPAPLNYTPPPAAAVTPGATQEAGAPDSSSAAMKLMMIGGGIPAGFLGAKFLYDKYREYEMNGKIDRSRNDYNTQLLAAQQQAKMASETPCTDSFCEAIADEMNKLANGMPGIDPSVLHQQQINDITPQLANIYTGHGGGVLREGVNAATMNSGDLWKNVLTVLGGTAAVGTAGSLMWANKQKREKEQKAQYPTRVVYGP